MKKEVITDRNPKSPVSEVFRSLRTNIQYLKNSNNEAQSIVITSTVQGEGKSWVTANLSVTFAQAGKNVVLIDSDMRRPRQNTIFGTEMFPGLSNYLSSIDENGNQRNISIRECVKQTEVDNLYLIPAGNIPPNPSELLTSSKMIKFLNELKKIFDVIIFDAAPCLVVTDSTIIGRLVDSTILVAASSKTRIDDIKEAKRRVEHVGGKIAGVVLNRVKSSGKKYGYSYNYRYYYTADGEKTKTKGVEHTDIAQMKVAKNDKRKNKNKDLKLKDLENHNNNKSKPKELENDINNKLRQKETEEHTNTKPKTKPNKFDTMNELIEKDERLERQKKNILNRNLSDNDDSNNSHKNDNTDLNEKEDKNNKNDTKNKKEVSKSDSKHNIDSKEDKDKNSKSKSLNFDKEEISSERITNILDEIKNYGGDRR